MGEALAGECGFWFSEALKEAKEAKRKRDEEFNKAVNAMIAAKSSLSLSIPQDSNTVPLEKSDAMTPLKKVPMLSPCEWATATLNIVKGLKDKNPSNTAFLTKVLKVTTNYIKNPDDKAAFDNYETMREEVATKYGRYSALSFALIGLPASILIGGMIGAIALGVAFPACVPVIAVVATIIVLTGALASIQPSDLSRKISTSWNNLKEDLGSTRPSLSR